MLLSSFKLTCNQFTYGCVVQSSVENWSFVEHFNSLQRKQKQIRQEMFSLKLNTSNLPSELKKTHQGDIRRFLQNFYIVKSQIKIITRICKTLWYMYNRSLNVEYDKCINILHTLTGSLWIPMKVYSLQTRIHHWSKSFTDQNFIE